MAKVITKDIKKKIEVIETQLKKEKADKLECEHENAEKKHLEQIEQEKMESEIKQNIPREQEECKIKRDREPEVRLRREMGEQIPYYLLVLASEISSPVSRDLYWKTTRRL